MASLTFKCKTVPIFWVLFTRYLTKTDPVIFSIEGRTYHGCHQDGDFKGKVQLW